MYIWILTYNKWVIYSKSAACSGSIQVFFVPRFLDFVSVLKRWPTVGAFFGSLWITLSSPCCSSAKSRLFPSFDPRRSWIRKTCSLFLLCMKSEDSRRRSVEEEEEEEEEGGRQWSKHVWAVCLLHLSFYGQAGTLPVLMALTDLLHFVLLKWTLCVCESVWECVCVRVCESVSVWESVWDRFRVNVFNMCCRSLWSFTDSVLQ